MCDEDEEGVREVEESGTAGGGGRAPPDLALAPSSHDAAGSSRRDENPFSLRHFLHGGGGGGGLAGGGGGGGAYERTGARPKTYAVPTALPGRAPAPGPLLLPDFVQDHLPAESVPPPPHQLHLDLTESVPHAPPPRRPFPLDLPLQPEGSGGGLPDFLPTRPGRASPDIQRHSHLHTLLNDTRLELSQSRERAARLEGELEILRDELHRRSHYTCAACGGVGEQSETELERLRAEVQQLRESEGRWRRQAGEGEARAGTARRRLTQVANMADTTLRELVQQLASLSSTLDPP